MGILGAILTEIATRPIDVALLHLRGHALSAAGVCDAATCEVHMKGVDSFAYRGHGAAAMRFAACSLPQDLAFEPYVARRGRLEQEVTCDDLSLVIASMPPPPPARTISTHPAGVAVI